MPDIHITQPGVEKLLLDIKVGKASGPDEVPAKMLKELAPVIAKVLTSIYNATLLHGSLPDDWLKANVCPVFKKGETFKASNYRPVSLSCLCCKIMEHIVLSNMMNHIDNNNIFVDNQHGFRSKRSTESQLLITIDQLANNMCGGGQTDVIVLDFSKAFDKVDHRKIGRAHV